MVWITRTDKPLSDPTGLSSKEAVSTVLNTRVIPAWSPSTQKEFCKISSLTVWCSRLRCGPAGGRSIIGA